jgi:hypothetical protein
VIRPEDRNIVIAVATQMWCARIQANEAKMPNGQQKYGYTPDVDLIVGEAAAIVQHASKLVEQVDAHIPPREREPGIHREEKEARKERRRNGAIELQWNVAAIEVQR